MAALHRAASFWRFPYDSCCKVHRLQPVASHLAPRFHGDGAHHRKARQNRLPTFRPRGAKRWCKRSFATVATAYARLAELNKTDVAYAAVLARFGVAQVKSGRRTGGKLNCRDIMSRYCQRKKNVVVERLDHFDNDEESWAEVLVEDKRCGPADTAIVRIDFSTWLQLLPRRLRKIATFLGNGETTTAASKRFHISQGRISQIRRELFLAWQRFQGEEPAFAVA